MAGLGNHRTVHYRFLPPGADPSITASRRSGSPLGGNCLNPNLALDRAGFVYLLYESADGGRRLDLRRTSGASGTWSDLRQVTDGGVTLHDQLAVAPGGKLHIVALNPALRVAWSATRSARSSSTRRPV